MRASLCSVLACPKQLVGGGRLGGDGVGEEEEEGEVGRMERGGEEELEFS